MVQIYFPEKNGLFLVPISRPVKDRSPEALANELAKGPKDSMLLPAFRESEVPVKVTTQGDAIQVDFQKPPSLSKWPALLDCFMATFQQLHHFHQVEFLVQGQRNVVVDGREFGEESLETYHVNERIDASFFRSNSEEGRIATVYYVLKGTPYLVPITQYVSSKTSLEEAIVEAIEERPPFSNLLQSPLPTGSKVLSISRPADHKIEMTVNLSGSSLEKRNQEKALLLTYLEIPGIQSVRIREKNGFVFGLFPKKRPSLINKEDSRP